MTTYQRWMPQSAQQIRTKSFPPSRWGKRGYHADEVDAYLARLAEDAAQSADIIAGLRTEVERLQDYIRNQGTADDRAVRRAVVQRDAVDLLTRAQHQADQLVAAAQQHAHQLVVDARDQRDQIIATAHQEAEQAAHTYRHAAGTGYDAEVEQRHRHLAWLRTVAAALSGVRAQLPAVTEQVEAIAGTFDHEVRALQDELQHTRQITTRDHA